MFKKRDIAHNNKCLDSIFNQCHKDGTMYVPINEMVEHLVVALKEGDFRMWKITAMKTVSNWDNFRKAVIRAIKNNPDLEVVNIGLGMPLIRRR